MASKTISVVGADNTVRKVSMTNEDGYKRMLGRYNVSCLVDKSDCEIFDFGALVHGDRYTLGEKQQLDANMQELVAFVQEQKEQKEQAKTLVFSKVQSDAYHKVTADLGVVMMGAEWSQRPTGQPDMEVFTWFNSKEDSQENRNGYMEFLNSNIGWPDTYAIVDCSEDKNLLSRRELGGKHKTSGNIDVVLAETKDVKNRAIRQNIRAGFELKKPSNTGDHEQQVILQHLTASSLNPTKSVLTVMTDLNSRWNFYWFGLQRGILYKYIAHTGSEAKFLLEHMFDASDPAAVKSFPTDFLCRATWSTFFGSNLSAIRENPSNNSQGDGDDFSPDSGRGREGSSPDPSSYKNDSKSDNKNDSKEAGAHRGQVAGSTYGMDVANELDLLDFVDEEEKREIQLRFLANHVLPNMTYVPDHGTQETEHHELSAANLAFHNSTQAH